MLTFFRQWNQWLTSRMYLLVFSALIFGFMVKIPNFPHLGTIVIGLFAYATFVTALGISFREFITVLAKPWIPLWTLFLIHILTPLIAWAVSLFFYPNDPLTTLGYLIGAAIPIGVTSILWTDLAKGNAAVALVAVTLDTLLVPVLLPIFFKYTVGQSIHIDYGSMSLQMLWMITVPSILGMLLHDLTRGRIIDFSQAFGGFTSKWAFALVIFLNAAVVSDQIHWAWPLIKTIFVSFLMVAIGYLIGYAGALVINPKSRETAMAMMYCVGLRNISFGMVLAISYFPPQVAVPITLFMLFQQPLAALVPKLYDRFAPGSTDGSK
jgi:predicted Na+-dependent transporter